jgi:hypothetical protein
MNIHINEIELFNNLNEISIDKFLIGSHLYNMNNFNSDTDYLSIFILPFKNRNSFLWEHHQLQYKNNNIDFNFSTIQGFIRNTISGDSTINFELLYSEEFKNSELNWLHKYKEDFNNYSIIRSYLGLAKRDLKIFKSISQNNTIINNETNKKLFHFCRSVLFSNLIMNNDFSLLLNNKNKIFSDYTDHEILKHIKNGTLNFFNQDKIYLNNDIEYINKDSLKTINKLIEVYENNMNELRNDLNILLDKKQINKFMEIKKLQSLDNELEEYIYNKDKNKNYNIDYVDFKDYFYKALENGITYN